MTKEIYQDLDSLVVEIDRANGIVSQYETQKFKSIGRKFQELSIHAENMGSRLFTTTIMHSDKMEKYSYIDLVKKLPKPTSKQIDNFIDMFTYDHSWYKKLPKDRIHDFLFYINPNAGRTGHDLKKFDPLSGVYYYDFMDKDCEIKTFNYQNKCGYLAYFVNRHPDIKFERDSQPFIELNFALDSRIIVPVPDEIINIFTIKLSKYVAECYTHHTWGFEDEEDRLENVSYAQKHEEIIKELRLHLLFIVDYIYA